MSSGFVETLFLFCGGEKHPDQVLHIFSSCMLYTLDKRFQTGTGRKE
jgi:hypothetical protein